MSLHREDPPRWHKSSYSGSGNCVSAAAAEDAVLVRNTRNNGAGPVLSVSHELWTTFIEAVKAGQFTHREKL